MLRRAEEGRVYLAIVHKLQHARDLERSEDRKRGLDKDLLRSRVKHEAKVCCCVSILRLLRTGSLGVKHTEEFYWILKAGD